MKKIILVSLLFVPIFASASIDINLKYGATGPEVVELQEFLIEKGFLDNNATGNFFSLTNSAVIKYQGSVGLPITGFVGPMTREKINVELGQKVNTANQQEVLETGSNSAVSVNDKITQMLNQIKVLQELIAKQNQTQQSTLESIKQIQQNTTPIPVYIPPAPAPVSVSLGIPYCNEFSGGSTGIGTMAWVPIEISGRDDLRYTIAKANNDGSSYDRSYKHVPFQIQARINATSTIVVQLGSIEPTVQNNYTSNYKDVFTDTIFIGNVCQ